MPAGHVLDQKRPDLLKVGTTTGFALAEAEPVELALGRFPQHDGLLLDPLDGRPWAAYLDVYDVYEQHRIGAAHTRAKGSGGSR